MEREGRRREESDIMSQICPPPAGTVKVRMITKK